MAKAKMPSAKDSNRRGVMPVDMEKFVSLIVGIKPNSTPFTGKSNHSVLEQDVVKFNHSARERKKGNEHRPI